MRIVLGLLGVSPFAALALYRLLGDMIASFMLAGLAAVVLLALLAPGERRRSNS